MDPILPAQAPAYEKSSNRTGEPGVETLPREAHWPDEQVWIFRMVGLTQVEGSPEIRATTRGELLDLSGSLVGRFTALEQPGIFTAEGFQPQPWDPADLQQKAPKPEAPFDRPRGIQPVQQSGQIAVHFEIGEGVLTWIGTIRATMADGNHGAVLHTSAAGLIVGGDGDLAGARGVGTILSTGDLLHDLDLRPGSSFASERLCALRVTPPLPAGSTTAVDPALWHERNIHSRLDNLILGYGLGTQEMQQEGSEIFLVTRGKLTSLESQPMGQYVGCMPLAGPLDLAAMEAASAGQQQISQRASLQSVGSFKTRFQMDDGAIDLVGSGYAHVQRLGDRRLLSMTGNGLIAGGTGCYQGLRGAGCIQGSGYLESDAQPAPGAPVPFKTLFLLLPMEGSGLACGPLVRSTSRAVSSLAQKTYQPSDPGDFSRQDLGHPGLEAPSFDPQGFHPMGFGGRASDPRAEPAGLHIPISDQPSPGSLKTLIDHLPPGVNPKTFDLEKVDQMMDRIAAFLLYGRHQAGPIRERVGIVGFRVTVPLGRLDTGDHAPTARGMTANNQVSFEKCARLKLELRFAPPDDIAHHGQSPPLTRFEPNRNQRFVVTHGQILFHDELNSKINLFGTGQTFPKIHPGAPLSLGFALAVVSSTGAFQGLPGMVCINLLLEPSWAVDAAVLIRSADPDGRLILPAPPPLRAPEPIQRSGSTFFMLRGTNDVQDPTEVIVTPDGRMTGAHLRQQISTARLGFEMCRPQGLCTGASFSSIICHLKADMFFNPVAPPPVPFTIEHSTFAFYDARKNLVGELHANIVEGRGFPTFLPGLRLPLQRGAALAPITGGSGIFEGARGLITVINWISIFPRQVSGFFLVRLIDQAGRFRAAPQLGCVDCHDGRYNASNSSKTRW